MAKFKLVPRKEGDPPLSDVMADAVRKAGFDPAKFTIAPESGEADVASALPRAGQRVRHDFRFRTVNGALAAIERVLDDELVAQVAKRGDAFVLTLDAAASADDAAAHRALAARIADLGAEDAGMVKETVAVNTRVTTRGSPT